MKAIILAAGEGKRLRPLTADRPKCLVMYCGKPIIDYQLEAMRECGIEDIIVVKGYKANTLQREGVRFILNPLYDQSNMVYSLFLAESEMNDDIIISYGDIVYEARILKTLLDAKTDFAITIDEKWRELWNLRMNDPLKDAETLKINSAGNIIELGRKPKSYAEIQGQYMGLIKISKGMLTQVRDSYHGMDRSYRYDRRDFNNMFMTSFLQCLIDKGMTITAVPIAGGWLEIDRPSDLKLKLRGF